MHSRGFFQVVGAFRSAILTKRSSLSLPPSTSLFRLLTFLNKHGYISRVQVNNSSRRVNIQLKVINNKSLIQDFRSFSKPTRILTLSIRELSSYKFITSVFILDTPYGLLSHNECISLGIGGIVIGIISF